MPQDPMDIYNREREERMQRFVPTRDSVELPTFGLAQSKASESDERIRQHERARFIDFFTRRDGRAPTEEMLPEHLRNPGGSDEVA